MIFILLLLLISAVPTIRKRALKRLSIAVDDAKFILFFNSTNRWKQCIGQNGTTPLKLHRPASVLFLTYETRDAEYIDLHKYSMTRYCARMSSDVVTYHYVFLPACFIDHPHNPYWCKMYLVRHFLKNYDYDYVVWLDSDVVLSKHDVYTAMNSYSSCFYIGMDVPAAFTISLNAGVFMCRNTSKCLEIVDEILSHYEDKLDQCLNANGTLNGKWAMTCYEQGVMNLVLVKHLDFLTVLPIDVIYSNTGPGISTVIYHNCAGGDQRVKNFKTFLVKYGFDEYKATFGKTASASRL